ncbi:hypothetical protein ACU4GD_22535 [Cupriavidus basilensis]
MRCTQRGPGGSSACASWVGASEVIMLGACSVPCASLGDAARVPLARPVGSHAAGPAQGMENYRLCNSSRDPEAGKAMPPATPAWHVRCAHFGTTLIRRRT